MKEPQLKEKVAFCLEERTFSLVGKKAGNKWTWQYDSLAPYFHSVAVHSTFKQHFHSCNGHYLSRWNSLFIFFFLFFFPFFNSLYNIHGTLPLFHSSFFVCMW